MSKSNRLGKELARQRAQQLREEQARTQRRRRNILVSVCVVAVIALVAGIASIVEVKQADAALKYIPTGAVVDTTGGVSTPDNGSPARRSS
jgi:uncharacterized membrane protein